MCGFGDVYACALSNGLLFSQRGHQSPSPTLAGSVFVGRCPLGVLRVTLIHSFFHLIGFPLHVTCAKQHLA